MAKTFVVHPDFEALKPQLQSAIDGFSENSDFVTKGERNVIKKIVIDGESYNIKSFKIPGLLQRWVYRFFRKSKARRSFEYASRLIDLGINTPFPVGYSETFTGGLKASYYISKHLD
ncbi:MAG: lipopolysaccharide kinase, partial [Flavobacteriaceae bacterium]|nr:lipopolysaccharide kinase [Flavobacteriaceae bacterium]